MPKFHNILNIRKQQLLDLKVTKDQTYFFDFFNHSNQFESTLYCKDANLNIAVLEFNKVNYVDFLKASNDEKNYLQQFTYKKGDIPR